MIYAVNMICIVLTFIDSKVIKLKASSEKEAQKWIQSIDDAIAKYRSQYFTET